jgi:hypothetical protein
VNVGGFAGGDEVSAPRGENRDRRLCQSISEFWRRRSDHAAASAVRGLAVSLTHENDARSSRRRSEPVT